MVINMCYGFRERANSSWLTSSIFIFCNMILTTHCCKWDFRHSWFSSPWAGCNLLTRSWRLKEKTLIFLLLYWAKHLLESWIARTRASRGLDKKYFDHTFVQGKCQLCGIYSEMDLLCEPPMKGFGLGS